MSAPVELELNLDGLVGPTHSFAGLATGNLAAARNAEAVSNPRAAVRQGLAKMRTLVGLGVPQGVLPPHERPHVPTLRRMGFTGSDHEVVRRAATEAPGLFRAVSSASSMWVANAATVSAAADTADGRLHLTPANLASHLHRSIESDVTARILRATFPSADHVVHHRALPSQADLGDEGAANHTRLVVPGRPALSLFVYGRRSDVPGRAPRRFTARQTLEASWAVARQHGLDPDRVAFVQQHPGAIDRGVFHNDVIAVGHRHVLFHHEDAFLDGDAVAGLADRVGDGFRSIGVSGDEIGVEDAVGSYLFNSQLVTAADGTTVLVCPIEVTEHAAVRAYVDGLVADPTQPIDALAVLDLRQSMRNGGGPACLRLRIPVDDDQLAAINPGSLVDDDRLDELERWVDRHYRDRLVPDDLVDPALLDENRTALDELTRMLGLGAIYEFQRDPTG